MARHQEYKRAKTCKHAIQLTEFGGLFVRESCNNEHKLMLPCPNQMGIKIKRPYIMAKYCSGCTSYEERNKIRKNVVIKKAVKKKKG